MAGTPSYLFDQAYARILSTHTGDPDDPPPTEPEYNFKAYISEPSYVEAEPWGDLSAQMQYKDETADRLATLRTVVPLEVPRTAARSMAERGGESKEERPRDRAEAVPTTKLMQKLFKTGGETQGNGGRGGAKTAEMSEPVELKLNRLISEKIEELNNEVSKQTIYQEKLSLLKRQVPDKSKAIEKEKAEILATENAAREEIRAFRESELQKAEKELRVRERNQKALAALPSRKEREEKESLLAVLQKLQEEGKSRKARHQLAKERLNKQLEDARNHHEELLREKERMVQIMPGDAEVSSVMAHSNAGNKRVSGTCQREISPEMREPIDQTFEEPPPSIRIPDHTTTSYHDVLKDGRPVRVYADGHEETMMQSGTRREVYSNGFTLVRFANGDEKRDFPDGKSVYFYSAPGTTQIVHPSGLQVYFFSDGQKETHYLDGSKKIRFPNGTKKTIQPNGEECATFLDGLVVETDAMGMKTTLHPGGHKDIVYPDGRRLRQLANGTLQRLS